ncbi:MAG: serine protein kinase PrkA [Myxococcaceae bacterium]
METWVEDSKSKFKQSRSILSFDDYLEEVKKQPKYHLRNAAQYFWDVIQHFGYHDIALSTGTLRRYKLFDAEFNQYEGQVLGQERVQGELVRLIHNFVRSGRIDRLILLHGPNGSAKTSLIQAFVRGAEYFSHQDQGALYRFNWVFPAKKSMQGGIGFASDNAAETDKTYAYLDSEQLESKIICEYKDHPILLLSQEYREALLKEVAVDLNIADIFKKGDLSAKNKKIFNALLLNYKGDFGKVYKHIQVERFYLSKRYRTGIGCVEPQMSVDAYSRQITADQSLVQLHPALQHMTLHESGGALADGHRGLLEYNDLLKRPIESWKYLLVATEQAQASLDVLSLFLDSLIIASSNELHLNAFREYPDWQSFKGRFELIKVPYLLRFSDEVKIYENQIPKALAGTHIAPHSLEIAARWAVLTRLEAPKLGQLTESQDDILRNLSPLEKLELYDTGTIPERLTQKEAKDLKKLIPVLFRQYADDLEYEGRFGASPREIRMILLNAGQNKNFDHLSPVAVLEELQNLTRERSSYDFLRRESIKDYRNPESLIQVVRRYYIKQLDEEIKNSLGLIEPDSHFDLFERYVRHVSAWTKREKILNPMTGKMVDPDSDVMHQVENILIARLESPEEFRNSLITRVGAFRLEQPDQPVDYYTLFGGHLKRIKEDYYAKQTKTVTHIQDCYLKIEEGDIQNIDEKDQELGKTLKENLLKLGYNSSSARQAVAYLLLNRN